VKKELKGRYPKHSLRMTRGSGPTRQASPASAEQNGEKPLLTASFIS